MAEPNCKKCIHKAVCDNYEQWIGDITGFENIRATKCPYFQESGWVSVEDRLPEVNKPVLTYGRKGSIGIGFVSSNSKEWVYFHPRYGGDKSPVHWMPLPEPPKEG